MSRITIYHLYPDHLNLYGDRGNILALQRRARWHGIEPVVAPMEPGKEINLERCHILFMGGAQEAGQKLVYRHFAERNLELFEMIEKGLVILAICGSFQLLGRYYTDSAGEKIPGLGLFNFYTTASRKRAIGDIITRSDISPPARTLVGFENHAGLTFLGSALKPLGTVLKGHGNNGRDRTEGLVYRNVIGTYLHGAILPKNPWLTDYLLQKALQYSGSEHKLSGLDDTLEEQAHHLLFKRRSSPFFHRRYTGLQ